SFNNPLLLVRDHCIDKLVAVHKLTRSAAELRIPNNESLKGITTRRRNPLRESRECEESPTV
ncbi:hypothetical protein HAX54_019338, partial [Datura stramonium]|nr:hypothetical protein [Datura stramonium]